MRTAAQVFYLAIFALLRRSHAEARSATKSYNGGPDQCAIEPKATVSDACASYSTIDSLNEALAPPLKSITQTTDFFAYYRLNLYNRVCPFWSDESGMCGNFACAVQTLVNEEDIPKIWRAEELGKLEGPKAGHPGKKLQRERGQQRPLLGELGDNVGESCVVEYDDECDERDYCIPEDEGAAAKGDYVSLLDNPERFTGYAGPSAKQVWDTIYRENCFSKPPTKRQGVAGISSGLQPGGLRAALDLKSVMKEHSKQQLFSKAGGSQPTDDNIEFDDECLEKRVFYRVISGMHASISAHICWDYLNQSTGKWGPNLQCYEERLHNHPERISNLYFNYAVVLRAVAKLRGHLKNYTFCSGDPVQDRDTKQKVLALVDQAATGPQIFDESLMFQDPSVAGLKEDFRNRFRNVSRIMDCVGCDKCRLWGKLQTAGYGTALKVLFEFDEFNQTDNPPLRRTELVALVNTLGRISNSLSAVGHFRKMIEARDSGLPMGEEERKKLYDQSVTFLPGSASAKTRTVERAAEKTMVKRGDLDFEQVVDESDDFSEEYREPTIADAFWEEWDKFYEAFWIIMRSYYELPGTLWHISLFEMSRLWSWWIGSPIQPRNWTFGKMEHLRTREL